MISEKIKCRQGANCDIINDIIDMEWEMFDKVNNMGCRASCQDDQWTFYVMRYSQHNAFSRETLSSYKRDLEKGRAEGRNLLTEKYAFMMEPTDPAYFESQLKPRLPQVSEEKEVLVEQILNLSLFFQKEFEGKYPMYAKAGRPVSGEDQNDVSFTVYLVGELKTYSEETLRFYLNDLKKMLENGSNIAQNIQNTTAKFYGYEDVEDAERRILVNKK